MARARIGGKSKLLEAMLSKASWQVSHAIALLDQGQSEEAQAELLRAAASEEQVACLLEAEGHDVEAAAHQFLLPQAKHYVQAVALLRSALSFSLTASYRREIEGLLRDWLPKAQKQLRRQARKAPVPIL